MIPLFYWSTYFLAHCLKFPFFRLKVTGGENVPKHGGFIFASNHLSYLDPFILGMASPRRMQYIARESLFTNPAFSILIKGYGAVPIKRDSADLGAIKTVIRILKKGIPVLIFPEGTRIKNSRTKRVQAGVGLIACKTGLPVVPVYVEGTDHVLAPGAKKLSYGSIHVRFGKPIAFTPEKSYQEFAFDVMQAAYNLVHK